VCLSSRFSDRNRYRIHVDVIVKKGHDVKRHGLVVSSPALFSGIKCRLESRGGIVCDFTQSVQANTGPLS
jgi:hypothetical protein